MARMIRGCSVPVFRYALERWEPDLYEAAVRHAAPLTPEQAATVGSLRDLATGDPPLNVRVTVTQGAAGGETRPTVELRYPSPAGADRRVAVAFPLSPDTVEALRGSPVREELVRRLTDGVSAVWLFLGYFLILLIGQQRAVHIQMDDVVIAFAVLIAHIFQVVHQRLKGAGAHNINLGRHLAGFQRLNQRAGDGAVADIPLTGGAGGDQQHPQLGRGL